MPFIVDNYYGDRELRRLRVKPGITGLWQVSPHRNDPIHEHLEYDLAYIARRGPLLDLALIVATLGLAKSTGK
jgi:lipopolysaccharide/colanic/teichoic acid biosynthesis glycosyltransferase